MTWTNWAGDQACSPAIAASPRTVEELSNVIAAAASGGRVVRVVGAGHSFSDLVCTSGTLVSMDELSGLLEVDDDAGLVRVLAGTRLYDLNRLLDEQGLALPNLGDIDRQSVAGAISTGTHGTGRKLGNLATQVESLDLVVADGSVLECTADKDPDTLAAARVSLGALGVVSSYTLRVVPAFTLRGVDQPKPLEEVIASLDDLVDRNDHFEFFLFPYAKLALTRSNNRTGEAPAPRGRAQTFIQDTVVENRLLDLICKVGRRVPAQVPRLNRLITSLFSNSTRVDQSYRIFSSDRPVRFTETEWAIPRAACGDMLGEVNRVIEQRRLPVGFPLEVRFVAGDEQSLLSPAFGRETAYIAAHQYQGMEHEEFFAAVQDIAAAHGGRPHWGKRHTLDAGKLAPLYPEWDRFQQIRADLDPEGRFANEHIRRVLGPTS